MYYTNADDTNHEIKINTNDLLGAVTVNGTGTTKRQFPELTQQMSSTSMNLNNRLGS